MVIVCNAASVRGKMGAWVAGTDYGPPSPSHFASHFAEHISVLGLSGAKIHHLAHWCSVARFPTHLIDLGVLLLACTTLA